MADPCLWVVLLTDQSFVIVMPRDAGDDKKRHDHESNIERGEGTDVKYQLHADKDNHGGQDIACADEESIDSRLCFILETAIHAMRRV